MYTHNGIRYLHTQELTSPQRKGDKTVARSVGSESELATGGTGRGAPVCPLARTRRTAPHSQYLATPWLRVNEFD
ncbi:hypothetical protein NDU88_004523 [Pleurodeles waltl]|uniref:Uncharacterized protein n=1 Tax=Pleurodeles waltl TaxID=8319 RepID=A0AAV7UFY5_PLEWA|nr:hypothetical protein NDU88_004523 [Pleurodeles waltl]